MPSDIPIISILTVISYPVNCISYFEGHPQDGTLRLVDGSNSTRGRLEIFHERKWGTICDDSFGKEEAQVKCCISLQCCTLYPTSFKLSLTVPVY